MQQRLVIVVLGCSDKSNDHQYIVKFPCFVRHFLLELIQLRLGELSDTIGTHTLPEHVTGAIGQSASCGEHTDRCALASKSELGAIMDITVSDFHWAHSAVGGPKFGHDSIHLGLLSAQTWPDSLRHFELIF